MRRGKDIHYAIEQRIKGHYLISPEADSAMEWQLTRGDGTRWAETTFGINPQTGASEQFADREAVPKDWMPVVTDLIISGKGILEVWDWKTGSPFSSFSYEPQVKANAYAAAAAINRDGAVAGLAYLTPDGIKAKSWDLDAFDLIEQKQKLRMWAAQAPTAQPNPGAACKYCPARGICPAMAAKESA
jgi:hypothetical protein